MIRLAQDLFASLSASANVLRNEDSIQKVNASLSGEDFSSGESANYDRVVIDDEDIHHSNKSSVSKPIEETVEDIINNPEMKILKMELNAVEELFSTLKEKGENLDMLFRIEKRIEDLKRLIDQKSYV